MACEGGTRQSPAAGEPQGSGLELPELPRTGAMTSFALSSMLSRPGAADLDIHELVVDPAAINAAHRALDGLHQDQLRFNAAAQDARDKLDRSLQFLQRQRQEIEEERRALSRERSELAGLRAGARDTTAME